MTLLILNGSFAVCRLPADAAWPAWASGEFVSVTRTTEELSLVCREDAVPKEVSSEGGWRCLRVAGTLDFALVGVLASLVVPLAKVGVSVFVLSTFDTDYLLVKTEQLGIAVETLRRHGHIVELPGDAAG